MIRQVSDTLPESVDQQHRLGTTLSPQLDPRWALDVRGFLAVAVLCTLFVLASHVPLRSTDLWSHVAWGQWIVEHGRLPQQDPFLPQYAGMPVVDTAWGAQVILALTYRWGGVEGLSLIYALCVLLTFAFLLRAFYLTTGHLGVSLAVMLLCVVVGWTRLLTIRPENFGTVAFALLIWLLATACKKQHGASQDNSSHCVPNVPWFLWWAVPGLFVVWANVHGSFVCGLVVLGAMVAGAALEQWERSGSLRAVLHWRRVHQWLLLTELALAATLLNPYGVELLWHTVRFSANPNLEYIVEWRPLVLVQSPGPEFVLSLVVMALWWRWSRARVRWGWLVAWAVFAVSVAWAVRMIHWYAFVWGMLSAGPLCELWKQLAKRRLQAQTHDTLKEEEKPSISPWRWGWSLAAGFFVWSAFVLSPASSPLLGARKRTPEQIYHRATSPVRLTQALKKLPVRGTIYTPQHWGDWILVHGPKQVRPWITSNIHLIPPRLWQDYVQVWQVHSGWDRVLQRHRISWAVVDKEMQRQLYRAMIQHRQWRVVYEDAQGAVFAYRNSQQEAVDSPGRRPTELSQVKPSSASKKGSGSK